MEAERRRTPSRGVGCAIFSCTQVVEWSVSGEEFRVPGVAAVVAPRNVVDVLRSRVSCTWTNEQSAAVAIVNPGDPRPSFADVKCSPVLCIPF